MREYFMETERIGFSKWTELDLNLAIALWGDESVSKYICSSGKFNDFEIQTRLDTEVSNDKIFGVQYWPIFDLCKKDFIGCCGLRPFKSDEKCFEIGFHICKKYWGKGLAFESAEKMIIYAFDILKVNKVFAGHHPDNFKSGNLLKRLGFNYIGLNYYEPTGLYHPSYEFNSCQDECKEIQSD